MSLLLSVGSVMTSILYIVLAIIVLMVMITIHELGHYTAGKLLKFKINEFSVGFGKAIVSKTVKSGEMVSLRVFPLGGFCAFEGEDEDDKENPLAFNNQKPWKRLIVLFMGAFFNFLSAILFSFVFLLAFGYSDRVVVTEINPIATGLSQMQVGDVIVGVNGEYTNFITDKYFIDMQKDLGNEGEEFFVTIIRNGEEMQISVSKTISDVDAETSEIILKLGISLENYKYGFFEAIGQSFVFAGGWAWKVLVILWQLISFQLPITSVGGTITTVATIAELSALNISYLFLLLPVISVNLAVFNLLPFPALDGMRMVFVGIEGIFKKPINRKVEGYIHFFGLIFLLLFVVLVDILHFAL